jgi:hypothetical protein
MTDIQKDEVVVRFVETDYGIRTDIDVSNEHGSISVSVMRRDGLSPEQVRKKINYMKAQLESYGRDAK